MATLRVAYITSATAQAVSGVEQFDPHAGMSRLANLHQAMNAGAGSVRPGSVQISVDDNATAASGTVTLASVSNNDVVTIGNVALTAKSSSPSGNAQWLCGVSNTADGAALAACINANPSLSPWVKAVNASGVVTITAINSAIGLLGNLLQLSSSNGTRLAVVGFASGAADASAVTYSF